MDRGEVGYAAEVGCEVFMEVLMLFICCESRSPLEFTLTAVSPV